MVIDSGIVEEEMALDSGAKDLKREARLRMVPSASSLATLATYSKQCRQHPRGTLIPEHSPLHLCIGCPEIRLNRMFPIRK